MRGKIEGLLTAVWTIRENKSGQEIKSPRPTSYNIETADGLVSITNLFEKFYDPEMTVFVVVRIQREDKDGTPI